MGQKFAAFNTQGNIVAYYDDVDSPIPAGVTSVIEITDEQWQACISTPGYTVQSGTLVAPTPPTAAQISAQQVEQQLAASVQSALAAGLAVTSAGTPAVNGTYPLDVNTQNEIGQVTLFIQVNGDFPGGTSSYPWFDTSNVPHVFPSVALHDEWATAIANYIAALKLYGAGVEGSALPAASITIA